MHIIFLIKKFKLSQCGLSDYIVSSSKFFSHKKINSTIIHCNKLNKATTNSELTEWSVFKVLKKIHKIQGRKIFFFQFSPFLQSKSGFSLKLILIFLYLKVFFKNIKIITNFHETANQFSFNIKYLIMYILHTMQLRLIFLLSEKVIYANKKFVTRFTFFKNKKSNYCQIFSNINNYFYFENKKKNIITFYNSHFNEKNFHIIFNSLKILSNKNIDFKLNFLGNCNKLNIIKIKKLLLKYSLLKNSNFFYDISEKKMSFLLGSSFFTIATRKGYHEQNSGFHQASLLHGHHIIEMNSQKRILFVNLHRNLFFKFNKLEELLKKFTKKDENKRNYIKNIKNNKKIYSKLISIICS